MVIQKWESADNAEMKISFTPDPNVNLEELSENTVLSYVEGVPIYVKDLNRDGTVNVQKTELVEKMHAQNLMEASSQLRATFADGCMKVVSTKYQNSVILVQATQTAASFSQKEVHTYLPNKAISDFAEALEKGTRSGIVGTLVSYIPGVGDVYTAVSYIMNSISYNNIDSLRTYRNAGNAASYSTYKSSYGGTTAVAKWDKKTIKGKNHSVTTADRSKYTVDSIKYGKKY